MESCHGNPQPIRIKPSNFRWFVRMYRGSRMEVLTLKTKTAFLSHFLFQQKGLDPLLKHHILDFITIVFKHDVATDEFF